MDARHARDQLARGQQHSTTEQEAVAIWPFGYHSSKGCVLRNGQVAPASCSIVERYFSTDECWRRSGASRNTQPYVTSKLSTANRPGRHRFLFCSFEVRLS